MATSREGPVVFTVLNQQHTVSGRILGIIWEGSTTFGDQAEIKSRTTNKLFWAGRTELTHTYIGANIGPSGIHAPNGFYASVLDAGRLLVYLREET